MNIDQKRVAIIGLGIEGVALCDFLIDKASSVTVLEKMPLSVIVEKAEPELAQKILKISQNDQIDFVFGENYLDGLENFDIVFRSPSFYFNDPALLAAKSKGVFVSTQIQLFFDLCPCKIIGVTGTKGKGTTSSLIFSILEKNAKLQISNDKIAPKIFLAGNIGYPAITLIPEIKEDDIVVLELSNFQLADLTKSPDVAVVTNLYVDHLDYHQSISEYHAAKLNILAHQKIGDLAVLNSSSTFDQTDLDTISSEIEYFGHNYEKAIVLNNSVILDPAGRDIEICSIDEINLYGEHNLENIAAASIVCDYFGVPSEVISTTVKDFVGLPHRLEFVDEINGIKFINDSFATNPEPTMAAIRSFDAPKIMILGGSSKGADFYDLAKTIADTNIDSVVLMGKEGYRIRGSLLDADYRGEILNHVLTIDDVVLAAYRAAKKGDVVIFSPACASFDMFKNYKDRGKKFKQAVRDLKTKEAR